MSDPEAFAEVVAQRNALKAEVERLKTELAIAQKFHDVAVKERDLARHQAERLKAYICDVAESFGVDDLEGDELLAYLSAQAAVQGELVTQRDEAEARIEAALAVDDMDNGMVIVKMREALTGGREK